jgi:hypothetical protein
MAETELKLEEAELQGENAQVEFPSLFSVLQLLLLTCVFFLPVPYMFSSFLTSKHNYEGAFRTPLFLSMALEI